MGCLQQVIVTGMAILRHMTDNNMLDILNLTKCMGKDSTDTRTEIFLQGSLRKIKRMAREFSKKWRAENLSGFT